MVFNAVAPAFSSGTTDQEQISCPPTASQWDRVASGATSELASDGKRRQAALCECTLWEGLQDGPGRTYAAKQRQIHSQSPDKLLGHETVTRALKFFCTPHFEP